jgi:hypothetical protein
MVQEGYSFDTSLLESDTRSLEKLLSDNQRRKRRSCRFEASLTKELIVLSKALAIV